MMKSYKYLFWDLDGTLTNSLPGVSSALDVLFNHYKINIPQDEYSTYVGPPLKTSLGKHFSMGESMTEALQIFDGYYNSIGIYEATLFDDIKTVLETLKNRGYIMYIATSKPENIAINVVKSFDIFQYFVGVYGANDAANIIEKEDVLTKIFSKNPHINKSDCLMIGDTVYDGHGAQALGIDFFAALYGFGKREDVLKMNPIGSVDKPLDYLNIFC